METKKTVFGFGAWKLPPPKILTNILDAVETFCVSAIVSVKRIFIPLCRQYFACIGDYHGRLKPPENW